MSDPDLPTPAEMVDAFVHPPRIVVVAARHDLGDDRLLLVSHVELWPWRVVIRGAMANRRPTTNDPMDEPTMRMRFHEHAAWMRGWSIADDVGTEYGNSTGGSSGWGNDVWADFHAEFHPPVPADARMLTLRSPDGTEFTVTLPATRR